MNLNDLLFGSRSLNDVPVQMQPALMPPGVLTAPQPDLNQYDAVTGGGVLSPDISMYRPDGTMPVTLNYDPTARPIGVLPGTQMGPSGEGVPGPAFGYTSNTEVFAGAPYAGAEIDLPGATGMPGQTTQGSPQTASTPVPAPIPALAPVAAPAAPQSPPALPPPVNVATRPVMANPVGSPAAPVTPSSDGGSDGTSPQQPASAPALKQGSGVLNGLYEAVGGDRLWNSKQGSKELLALGAGILSGQNLMDGLGRGAAAVAAVRANADATERDRADTEWDRQFRERQLQQQMKIAEGNQAMRMALVQLQQQAKAEAGNAKTADTVATLDSGIGQVQGFLSELDKTYKYDGVTGKISYEWNKAVDPSDKNFRLKKRLNEFATETLGELAKNFKPLSNEETRMLQSRVPNETSSVEEWKDYLTRVQTIMQRSREAAVNPKAFMENARTGTPQAAPAATQGADPLGLRR